MLVLSSPLSELIDDVIRIYRHDGFPDRPVVDQQHRAFLDALKASLTQTMAKLDQIEFVQLDDEGEDG